MAEETKEVIDIYTGEGTFTTVPVFSFEKGEAEFLTKTYGADKAESAIAENVAEELSLDFPNVLNYKQLRDGTAPLFDFLPATKNLSPSDRAFTDKKILDQCVKLASNKNSNYLGKNMYHKKHTLKNVIKKLFINKLLYEI